MINLKNKDDLGEDFSRPKNSLDQLVTSQFILIPGSSKVSGYTMQSGKLFFTNENDKEREVTGAVEIREGLKRFVKYLNNLAEISSQSSGDDEEKKKIILVFLTTKMLFFA